MTARNFSRIYDRFAKAYDLAIGPLLAEGHKMAVHAMDLKPGMKLLEVGIGTGLTLNKIPKEVDVTGIDLSKPMLEQAWERIRELGLANVNLHQMSAEALKFKDNSFDAVFAPSVLSVVSDPTKALDEMVRVCKSDGVICVVAHFSGRTWFEKAADRILDPLAQKLGFRMMTPREVIEAHSGSEIILSRPVLALNFSTLYLLKKIKE